jgi:hypothetical protein
VGTYVFTVKADDRDPPDAGGTINYTFVSAPGERLRFTIDSETGEIKTRHVSASYFLECCKLVCYLQDGDETESPGMWLQVCLDRCVTRTGELITGRVTVRCSEKNLPHCHFGHTDCTRTEGGPPVSSPTKSPEL